MADTSSLAAAANYLRQRGAELIVFVNVLGDGELFERSQLLDGAASAILWQESRRQLLREKGKGIEWIEVETSRMNVLDFDKRKELVRAGEMAGEKAAAMLVNKYGY